MKIVCVGYLHGSGGAERQIVMLSNALAERGHEVHLIVLAENKLFYTLNDSVILHDLSTCERCGCTRILNRYWKLRSELKKIRPQVSVHFWLQSTYLAAFMPKYLVGKVIYAERGDPGDSEYDGLLGIVRSIAFLRVDGFVFQSEGARDYFSNNIRKKSTVIHNSVCVPCDKYLIPSSVRDNRIVSVGRLHSQKNQAMLIEAFKTVLNHWPTLKLEIYGDGELKEYLNKKIEGLGLVGKVFLMGSKKDILDCIYSAKIFVLTSDYEGMPNALMEAMAIGLPCISTDCRPGGARTLIKNGVNGFIVERGNVDQLFEKLNQLLEDEAICERISKNAMEIRVTHTQKKVFDRWDKFLALIPK